MSENHVYLARILLEQGQTYLDKKSILAAQEHLQEALKIYDSQPIQNIKQHADTAEALGRVYLESGRPHDAHKMFEQALEIKKVLYGSSHPEIAETLHNEVKALLKISEYLFSVRGEKVALSRTAGVGRGSPGLERNVGDRSREH